MPEHPAVTKYPLVISVDPGKTTGVAACTLIPSLDDEKHRVQPEGFSSVEVAGGIDGFSEWFTYVSPHLMDHANNVVWVVERFTVDGRAQKHKFEYDALYIIGFLAGMQGHDNITFRMPSQRRVAAGKLFEWANPTKDNHADDAAMHLKAWLVDTFPYMMGPLLDPEGEA